jgi:hypothetical protein
LTSEYVRKKSGGKCYTCERKIIYKKLSAGHFIEKIGAAGIYFDLRGIRAQCFYCNRRLHGNKAIFAAKLIEENNGDATVITDLYKLCQKPKFWRKNELRLIEVALEEKIKELEK